MLEILETDTGYIRCLEILTNLITPVSQEVHVFACLFGLSVQSTVVATFSLLTLPLHRLGDVFSQYADNNVLHIITVLLNIGFILLCQDIAAKLGYLLTDLV